MRTRHLRACCLTLLFFLLVNPISQAQSIDGGATWTGWSSKGFSDSLGVYGSGSTNNRYEVYTTSFLFNNHASSGGIGGGPTGGTNGFGTGFFSNGAFVNGNSILGVGVRRISGAALTGTRTIRFDLNSNSYQAASSVGGSDGRTSFTNWSEFKDFSIQFDPSSSWAGQNITMQAGSGTSNGGPNNPQSIAGGSGSGVGYDWPFRAFGLTDSYQMFFDITAMQSIYGVSNPFGLNSNFTGIGTLGNSVRISLNGLGDNNVVINAALAPPPIPEPATASAMIVGMAGLLLWRRRSAKV